MYAILPFVGESSTSRPISVFGVFDGHGGQRVAQFASARLPEIFLKAFEKTGDVKQALESAFVETDQEIMQCIAHGSRKVPPHHTELRRTSSGCIFGNTVLQRALSDRSGSASSLRPGHRADAGSEKETPASKDHSAEVSTMSSERCREDGSFREPLRRRKSRAEESLSSVPVSLTRACGTTATVVTLVGDQFTVAHVGDSRAVLSSRDGSVIRLFEDHRPGRRDEMERIESAGGLVVEVSGTYRVNGVLAVSRAIGDPELKKYVIPKPEVQTFILSGEEEFLVIASDGLWDHINDEDTVELVRNTVSSGSNDDRPEERAAKLLVQSAWDRGSNDDVSVIVLNLEKYTYLWEHREEGAGDEVAIVEEMIDEVNLENPAGPCKEKSTASYEQKEGDDEVEMEMVTPMSAIPLETPRIQKSSPWCT